MNNYIHTSHLYDLDDRGIVKDDIPFYLGYAKQFGDEILEVACGTGRVTIPLAREGFQVTGFDLSNYMLDQFSIKLEAQEEEVKRRIHAFQADMTEFNLYKKFPLIIIPFRAFQLLIEVQQQTACLNCVREHLTDNGIFILNVFRPYKVLDESWIHPETEDWSMVDQKTGLKVRRTHIRRKIDVQNQITYPELKYYVENTNGNEECYSEELAMKFYYDDQLRNILTSNNFRIIEEFGYYDKRSIIEGPELIFVCKKN
jgi:SAM-dependent methyltransferase